MDIYDIEVALIDALYESAISCTIAEIKAMYESCRKYSIPQLSFAAKCLVNANIIEKNTENNETCFRIIFSSKKEAFLLLHKMRFKQLEQVREQNLTIVDKRSIAMDILNALYTAERPCTITEMHSIESCEKYSIVNIATVARKLVEKNIVEKVIENKKVYFKTIPNSKDEAIKILNM